MLDFCQSVDGYVSLLEDEDGFSNDFVVRTSCPLIGGELPLQALQNVAKGPSRHGSI